MEERPKRIRTQVYTASQLPGIAQDLLNVGYTRFAADDSIGDSSSSQDCQASLYYEFGQSQGLHEQGRVDGSTGNGHGHAEMDAIHQFWVGFCAKDKAVFVAASKAIQCEAKPCCVRCSAVLGLLGIPALPGTRKTRDTMGSTEWAVSSDVRDLLNQITGQPSDAFTAFGSLKYK